MKEGTPTITLSFSSKKAFPLHAFTSNSVSKIYKLNETNRAHIEMFFRRNLLLGKNHEQF